MRSYPRKTNRFLLLLMALLLWALGALAICLIYVKQVRQFWDTYAREFAQNNGLWIPVSQQVRANPVSLILLAVLVVLILIALGVLFSQGGGRKHQLISVKHRKEDALSAAEVSFIEDFFKDRFNAPQLIHSTSVSAWQVGKQTALRLDLTVKNGVDPVEVRLLADKSVAELDSLLGNKVPILVRLSNPWIGRKPARAK